MLSMINAYRRGRIGRACMRFVCFLVPDLRDLHSVPVVRETEGPLSGRDIRLYT